MLGYDCQISILPVKQRVKATMTKKVTETRRPGETYFRDKERARTTQEMREVTTRVGQDERGKIGWLGKMWEYTVPGIARQWIDVNSDRSTMTGRIEMCCESGHYIVSMTVAFVQKKEVLLAGGGIAKWGERRARRLVEKRGDSKLANKLQYIA
jgi:hypothetical protein